MRCDGETGQTGNEDNPTNVEGDLACKAEWDFIRGPHQGQQSRRLHTKAEDKTAPDQCAETSRSDLQRGSHPDKTLAPPVNMSLLTAGAVSNGCHKDHCKSKRA